MKSFLPLNTSTDIYIKWNYTNRRITREIEKILVKYSWKRLTMATSELISKIYKQIIKDKITYMVSLQYGLLSVWVVKFYLWIKLINKWLFWLGDICVLVEHFLTIDTQIYITCWTIANRSSHLNKNQPM